MNGNGDLKLCVVVDHCTRNTGPHGLKGRICVRDGQSGTRDNKRERGRKRGRTVRLEKVAVTLGRAVATLDESLRRTAAEGTEEKG